MSLLSLFQGPSLSLGGAGDEASVSTVFVPRPLPLLGGGGGGGGGGGDLGTRLGSLLSLFQGPSLSLGGGGGGGGWGRG